jgi:hypothetical protein
LIQNNVSLENQKYSPGNFGTLETLGPKIKIYWNLVLRASVDALEEVVLFCAESILTVQFFRDLNTQKRGSYRFSRTLGDSYDSAKVEGLLVWDETWWMLVQ